ncbi:MAG TPA: DIP1984 family protein [Aggregatilineales bacterium]|nr:DIP1984 family protein [Aggregatilineales bacterium]
MPKLAEALVERKGLQERLTRLQGRLAANAKVQEGETPSEPPASLVEQARQVMADIKRLTLQINATNFHAVLPGSSDGTTLMQAIAERDRLCQERKVLEALSHAANVEPVRGFGVTKNEVKWRATVDVAGLQKDIEAISQNYRLLDTRIQEANWLTDLIQN